MRRTAVLLTLIVLLAGCGLARVAPAGDRNQVQSKKVLIVTGIDYPGHKWKLTAPILAEAIAADNRLAVTITEEP
ncbi:MAG: hypothetical protein ACYTEK_19885, partial [Planctomycetota bacterium]